MIWLVPAEILFKSSGVGLHLSVLPPDGRARDSEIAISNPRRISPSFPIRIDGLRTNHSSFSARLCQRHETNLTSSQNGD